MNILDAKLNSIDGLDDVRVESSAASSQYAPVSSTSAPSASPIAQVAEEEPEPVRRGMKNKEDPRYAKYFKMLLVGVPLAQVQNKMMMEGVPPSVLEYVLVSLHSLHSVSACRIEKFLSLNVEILTLLFCSCCAVL